MLSVIVLSLMAPFLASNGSAVVEALAQDLEIKGSIPATSNTGKGHIASKIFIFQPMSLVLDDDEIINGVESVYENKYEDREFTMKVCKIKPKTI